MNHESIIFHEIEMETKTPNQQYGLVYDSRMIPSSGKLIVSRRESGQIVIGMITEHGGYEFNFLLKREEALAIVSAQVSAIKRQEVAQ